MLVYHWTTKENAQAILQNGLREWSYICRDINDWYGDVCLEVDLPQDVDWDSRDEQENWQAVVPERIPPDRICLTKRAADGCGHCHDESYYTLGNGTRICWWCGRPRR